MVSLFCEVVMWLKPDLLGPQKGPTTPGRIRAQWRQVDTEDREAREVRALWMRTIGFERDEIERAIECSFDLSLKEELEELLAAIRLAK